MSSARSGPRGPMSSGSCSGATASRSASTLPIARRARLLEEAGTAGKTLPVVVLFDGRILADPSNAEVGEALGVQTKPGGGCYDVTVIGAGPAGLAAAVYGASEGLSTVVLEPEAIGGQAGTSSLIRNYLGFPTGVSGADLAVRAYTQAWNFGAEYVYGNPATGLRPEGSDLVVTVADGSEVRSRAAVVATGMAYRRLGIPALDALTGPACSTAPPPRRPGP